MNRTAVALLAALESAIAAAIGLGIAVVPLTVLWAAKYGMSVSWGVFWRAACDLWLLGHGVDLRIALGAETTQALGLPGATAPFEVTIAALGCSLLVVLLGIRVGRRAARTPYPQAGVVAALAAYGLIALLVSVSAQNPVARPALWQGILLPIFVFAIGVIGGAVAGAILEPADTPTGLERSLRNGVSAIPEEVRDGIQAAVRGGAAATALTFAAAAVLLALALLVHFSAIVGLYQGLQTGVLGGAVLTLAQLAFLPNLVVWTASWLIGPGFAIGSGSSVSPLGTALGPIPGVPVLGALPHSSPALGFFGILVPVLAGLAAGLLVSLRQRRSSPVPPAIGTLVLTGIGIGVAAGILIGLAAWWSSGAIGPGRLAEAGPDPIVVGLVAAAETGVAGVVGMFAGGRVQRD